MGDAFVAVDAGFAFLHGFLHITLRNKALSVEIHGHRCYLMMMYLFDRLCKCELFTFLILQPVAGNDMGGPFKTFQK